MEQKIQMLIQFAVQNLGPILLRSGLGGGGTPAPSSQKNDDGFDDFDDDDDSANEIKEKGKAQLNLPTFAPDSSEDLKSSSEAPSRINLLDSSFTEALTSNSTLV